MDLYHLSQLLIHTAHAAGEAASEASNQSLAGTLGINWKLFIAQLINFGIILAVLWKWVFMPVAKNLAARTEKIEKSLSDAERIEKEKQEFTRWREQEMAKARSQANEIVTAAQNDASKAKQQIADETRQEQQKIISQAKSQIEEEKSRILGEAKSEIADMVTSATEKILKKKLDEKADKELIKESLQTIK